jgi:hypothetical protein
MLVSTSFLSLITPRTRSLAASTLVASMARPRPISLDPMVLWFSPIATSFTFVMGMAALRSSHSLRTHAIVANISTGFQTRADELDYDHTRQTIVVTNFSEKPVSVSIINAASRSVLGNIYPSLRPSSSSSPLLTPPILSSMCRFRYLSLILVAPLQS